MVVDSAPLCVQINVFELSSADCMRSYCFRGASPPDKKKLQEQLQLISNHRPGTSHPNRFVQPLSECELTLAGIIEELTLDPWPVTQGTRPYRCTGAALRVSLDLLDVESSFFFVPPHFPTHSSLPDDHN